MDRTPADDERPEIAESALSREDEDRELEHRLDRQAPSRRATWPKDDRRSSDRLPHSGPPGGIERREPDQIFGELPLQ